MTKFFKILILIMILTESKESEIVFYKAKNKEALGKLSIENGCTNIPDDLGMAHFMTASECVSVFMRKDCDEFEGSRNISISNIECYRQEVNSEVLLTEKCVMVYRNRFCRGASLQVFDSLDLLKSFEFSINNILSLRACRLLNFGGHVEVRFFSKTTAPNMEPTHETIHRMLGHNGCNEIPLWVLKSAVEFMWADSCIIIYGDLHCNPTAKSLKLNGGELGDLNILGLGARRELTYHPCTATEGGDYAKIKLYLKNEIKYTFHANDLCSCKEINLPSSDSTGARSKIKIENHGTCLKLYVDSQCTKWLRTIPAGTNAYSEDVLDSFVSVVDWYPQPIYDIKSLELCDFPKACINSTIVPYKVKLLSDNLTSEYISGIATCQAQSDGEYVMNNATANINKTFDFSINMTMILKIDSSVYTNTPSGVLKVESNSKLPSFIPFSVLADLIKSHYSNMPVYLDVKNNFNMLPYTTSLSELKQLLITKTITIPGCTVMSVQHCVRYVWKLPIPYEVYAKVTGSLHTVPLSTASASKLRDTLPYNMEYVQVIDENTIIAKITETIYVTFGLNDVITKNETSILNCGIREPCNVELESFEAHSY